MRLGVPPETLIELYRGKSFGKPRRLQAMSKCRKTRNEKAPVLERDQGIGREFSVFSFQCSERAGHRTLFHCSFCLF